MFTTLFVNAPLWYIRYICILFQRLKEKLETAVEYEKKLTKEIQEDRETEERIKDIIESNNVCEDIKTVEKYGEIERKGNSESAIKHDVSVV